MGEKIKPKYFLCNSCLLKHDMHMLILTRNNPTPLPSRLVMTLVTTVLVWRSVPRLGSMTPTCSEWCPIQTFVWLLETSVCWSAQVSNVIGQFPDWSFSFSGLTWLVSYVVSSHPGVVTVHINPFCNTTHCWCLTAFSLLSPCVCVPGYVFSDHVCWSDGNSFDRVSTNSSHTPHFVLVVLPHPHPSLTQSVCLNSVVTVYFGVQQTTFLEKDSVYPVMALVLQVRGVLRTGVALTRKFQSASPWLN